MLLPKETTNEKLVASSETKQQVYEFLREHRIGVLSTTSPDKGPHGTVIYFSVDENFVMTFITKDETRKHQNLQADPRSALLIYDASSQTTVQIIGKSLLIDNAEDKGSVLKAISSLAPDRLPIEKLEAGGFVAYQLLPAEIRMAVFSRPEGGGYDIFETIYFDNEVR